MRLPCVWEFQNSYLNGEAIKQREQAYKNLLWIWNIKEDKLVTFSEWSQSLAYEIKWYKLRNGRICEEASKSFMSYWKANYFMKHMEGYGWKVDSKSLNFIDFQNSRKYKAKDFYAKYKKNSHKLLWQYKVHALSNSPQNPKWLPDVLKGVACRFWWKHSQAIKQCKKPIILELSNNLFFAISNVYTDNISTFVDFKYGIRIQENAVFVEGYLFEVSKRELIGAFEYRGEPKQLSLDIPYT